MNVRRPLAAFLALLLAVIGVQAGLAQGAPPAKKWRVAMILPGAISDKGFNESGYNGLMLVKDKLGLEVAFSESTPVANFERVYRGFADDGYDIIIGHGFEFWEVAQKVAKDYPKQIFIVTDHPELEGPNYASFRPQSKDAAFLVGVLAGLTTKTGKVGAVAGFDFPVIVGDVEALRLGIKSGNPKAELLVVYIGTFDDPAKGKEAALAQISAGADVIYHIADSAGLGAIQAAQEKGVSAIGWGIDQNAIAPKTVIATEIVDSATMILQEVKSIMDSKFDGKVKNYGLETGVVGVSSYHGLVPDEVAGQVEKWKQAIISKAVEVPYMSERDAAVKLAPIKLPAVIPTAAATAAPTAAR